jgi:hypothetical protein
MRLFEVASPEDAREVLAVIKGLANRKEIPSKLDFATFKRYINGDEIGIGDPESLVALKDKIDPTGDVIKDVRDDGTVILSTKSQDPSDPENIPGAGGGKGLDQMAQHAAREVTK